MFAVMTPQQFAHVNVGTTPAHPNAMCIAETLAVAAGEPHARELVRQLQNQGRAMLHDNPCSRCTCLVSCPAAQRQRLASLPHIRIFVRLVDDVTVLSC